MKIKDAVYKTVTVKQKKIISQEVYGCDECRKEIKEYPNEDSRLELTVFHHKRSGADHLHLCSWDCVLKHVPKVKSDYFITLPMIYMDAPKNSKRGATRLFKLLHQLSLSEGKK